MIFGLLLLVTLLGWNLALYFTGMVLYGEAFAYQMVLLVGGWTSIFIVFIMWGVYEMVFTPTSAKTLRKCRMTRHIPVFLGFDTGKIEIQIEKASSPSGTALITDKDWRGFVPRPQVESEFSDIVNPILTKKNYMPDVGTPVWFGCASKAVLTNLQSLIYMGYAPLAGNPHGKFVGQVGEGDQKKEINVFWPITLTSLKQYFPLSWNQGQIRDNELQSEKVGYLEAKKYQGKEKTALILGMVVLAILILGIVFMVVFK